MHHILVVDDESRIRAIIRKYAEFEGHTVTEAGDGMEAVVLCRKETFDLIIMDIMRPELDGFSACREIRKITHTPIIMLSARGEEYDKINGFELGVDDYVVKPFSPKELMLRVEAIMKRSQKNEVQPEIDIYKSEGLEVNFTARRVYVDGEERNFTTKEFDLLTFLAENPNHVYTKEELFREIWDMESIGDIATVTVHIKKIREKVEMDTSKPQYIETIWGVGYRFKL